MKIKGIRLFKVNEETNKHDQINISRFNAYWCINGNSHERFRELNHAIKYYLERGYWFHENSVIGENEFFMEKN